MKLTEQDRIEIRVKALTGSSQVQLAKEYKVSRTTIQNTIRGYFKKRKPHSRTEMEQRWYQLAKDNYKKLSSRPDAIKYDEHRWSEYEI